MNGIEKINVCVACDNNYARYAAVVIASVLKSANADDRLCFYVLDGGIEEENKEKILSLKSVKDCEINFVKIDNEMFSEYLSIKTHSYISIPTYYRLKLPTLLPNVDKIIYFDCDIVVNTSLRELFDVEMNDCVVAGVHDIKTKMVENNPTYVNAGMLVFDVKKMAEIGIEKQFAEWTKEHFETIKLGDQEIINEVLKGKIKIVDDEWNVQSSNFVNRSSYTNNPKIIHFVSSKKPWHFGSFSYHKDYYFKYLQLTPWALQTKEDKDYWITKNKICSFFGYLKYRPLFFLRPRFYQAVFHTYLKDILSKVFSIKEYNLTHKLMYFMGIKIKYPKLKYLKIQHLNPYYGYKKNNVDITTIPPATGQIRDIQLANLALLKELDYVCKKQGLTYWLDGGTLMGAVRHKGFIPWDDDIDTAMFREDYKRIIEEFNKTTRNPDIFAGYTMDKNNNLLIKIQHKKCKYLFCDIFPWDNYGELLSTEEEIAKTKQIKDIMSKELNSSLNITEYKQKVQEVMKSQILHPLTEENNKKSFVWGIDYHHQWKNWFTHYDVTFPLKTISFEGYEFPCMNNPDAFLTRVYGHYMDYPSKIGYGHSAYASLTEEEKIVIQELIKTVEKNGN